MLEGFRECVRISSKWILVKCQDQVCSGQMRWQTDWFTDYAKGLAFQGVKLRKVDRFDMIGHAIPQPGIGLPEDDPRYRKQKHAHGRGSTLLVFQKS